MFYTLRLLLGLAEAGTFPGLWYQLTLFFSTAEVMKALRERPHSICLSPAAFFTRRAGIEGIGTECRIREPGSAVSRHTRCVSFINIALDCACTQSCACRVRAAWTHGWPMLAGRRGIRMVPSGLRHQPGARCPVASPYPTPSYKALRCSSILRSLGPKP